MKNVHSPSFPFIVALKRGSSSSQTHTNTKALLLRFHTVDAIHRWEMRSSVPIQKVSNIKARENSEMHVDALHLSMPSPLSCPGHPVPLIRRRSVEPR